ncbi:MAG: hypothetical protein AAEC86_08805, partial [Pseudohongiellaceae bacterium]
CALPISLLFCTCEFCLPTIQDGKCKHPDYTGPFKQRKFAFVKKRKPKTPKAKPTTGGARKRRRDDSDDDSDFTAPIDKPQSIFIWESKETQFVVRVQSWFQTERFSVNIFWLHQHLQKYSEPAAKRPRYHTRSGGWTSKDWFIELF